MSKNIDLFKRLYVRDILQSDKGVMSSTLVKVFDRVLLQDFNGDPAMMDDLMEQTTAEYNGGSLTTGADNEELRNEVNRLSAILEKHGLE